ncbi:MAG TPA: CHAT domain-containing protein [Pseudonocardiaceae bacterium]
MPGQVLPSVLDRVPARVRELHERGIGAINVGRIGSGGRLLRTGLRLLGWPDEPTDAALTARILISLAPVEIQRGRPDAGLALLDEAQRLVAPADRGLLLQQRGLLLLLVGRLAEGLAAMDRAIPLLDGEVLARTLLNRAMLHQIAGRVRLATADLDRCQPIARDRGMDRLLAKVMHNRGYCALLAGDIPGALRDLEAARAGFAVHAEQLLPVVAVDRARVLLAAGLCTEAVTELDNALALFRGQRLTQEYGEAELVRAQAAHAVGDRAAARLWARRAERRFHRRGNETWAAVALLARLRAEFPPQRHRTAKFVARADQVAGRLAELGLANDAEAAAILAARARIGLGPRTEPGGRSDSRAGTPLADAATALRGRPGSHALLDTRLLRALAMAELGRATGRRDQVFRQVRAGLALLGEHRGRFGSVDLQTGTTGLGAELAAIGLAEALSRPVPAQVFRWLERSRAQAFGLRPVRPPADPATLDAVAELRQLDRVVRQAELAGRTDPVARRRCAELARTIRARGWQADGAGRRHAAAEFGAVAAELAARDTTMISYLVHRDRLLAILVANGRATLYGLADWPAVAESVGRLHSDLDALCGRALRAELDQVVRFSVRRQLDLLTAALLGPMRRHIGDRDLVVVPTDTLSGMPWGLLPDLRGRPVTVAPSATEWLHGQYRPATRPGPPLLIAGPDLAHSHAEVTAIASIYPASTILTGPAATVSAALPELAGRPVAHVAAHGHHEQENVLFSRLDLADGPLMAYDIQQLGATPDHVVLSSCDVGRMVVRTGDEILGFTAALLYSGTRNVVSSVGRVRDDRVPDVMYAYHRALANGAPAARALADCTRDGPLIPFVCFGS